MAGMISNIDEVAQFLKLVANSNRLLILCLLARREANVGELEQQLGVSQPALSQHLARMRQEGMLETRRCGQHIFYSIKDPRIVVLLGALEQIFEQHVTLVKDRK